MVHSVTLLVQAATELTGLSREELLSLKRKETGKARFAVMYAARALGYTSTDIGRRLGGRDHTTILSGAKRAQQFLDANDLRFTKLVTALLAVAYPQAPANGL